MNGFDTKPPQDAGFFVLMVLDPNQNAPVALMWGEKRELRDAADEYVSKNPRCRAYILKTLSEIKATSSIIERDSDSGLESKRSSA